jgi:phospholipid-binding lipoprotein MlaA
MTHKRTTTVLLLMCALLLGGCATTRLTEASIDPIDPNEKTNRKFYDFTDMVDRNVLAPVADAYIKYVPNPMQRSIGNFYDNLAYPNVILNDFLQGKVKQGFEDSLRFVVNSTIGLGGLFDMAAPMGLLQHRLVPGSRNFFL